MADSPYFECAYFDETYFDTDCAGGGKVPRGVLTFERREPDTVDTDELLALI